MRAGEGGGGGGDGGETKGTGACPATAGGVYMRVLGDPGPPHPYPAPTLTLRSCEACGRMVVGEDGVSRGAEGKGGGKLRVGVGCGFHIHEGQPCGCSLWVQRRVGWQGVCEGVCIDCCRTTAASSACVAVAGCQERLAWGCAMTDCPRKCSNQHGCGAECMHTTLFYLCAPILSISCQLEACAGWVQN